MRLRMQEWGGALLGKGPLDEGQEQPARGRGRRVDIKWGQVLLRGWALCSRPRGSLAGELLLVMGGGWRGKFKGKSHPQKSKVSES